MRCLWTSSAPVPGTAAVRPSMVHNHSIGLWRGGGRFSHAHPNKINAGQSSRAAPCTAPYSNPAKMSPRCGPHGQVQLTWLGLVYSLLATATTWWFRSNCESRRAPNLCTHSYRASETMPTGPSTCVIHFWTRRFSVLSRFRVQYNSIFQFAGRGVMVPLNQWFPTY